MSIHECDTASMNGCDVFVKLGGSILDHPALAAELVPGITALAGTSRILIMTGGGRAAKRIKANQRANGSDFYDCWKAGVYCLEVNAGLLASYSRVFSLVASLNEIEACFRAGNIGVFAPAGPILSSLLLIPNWDVTTDSMGLYFAHALGARRYVVVSDVDGIYERPPVTMEDTPPIPVLQIDELERLSSSKLDPSFPTYFRRYALPTVIVNGRYPARVSAALCGKPTVGTQIPATRWGSGTTCTV